jgi:hypothetical protein
MHEEIDASIATAALFQIDVRRTSGVGTAAIAIGGILAHRQDQIFSTVEVQIGNDSEAAVAGRFARVVVEAPVGPTLA